MIKSGCLLCTGKCVVFLLMLSYAPLFVSAQTKPNILIILTDDQGYGEISAYGAKDLKTPNLYSLFASGIKFTNFYANSPVCSPREGKDTIYEGGLKVPVAVVWSGKINPGTETNHLALTMDIYLTTLEAVYLKTSQTIDGKSFLSVLLNQNNSDQERIVYFTRREGGIT
jgi:arylsulfatase A-like enzyme